MLQLRGIEQTTFRGKTMNIASQANPSSSHQIRFQSLHHEGRAMAFPCDAKGQVHLDSLSERARQNYLFARAVVGREYAHPAILPTALH